MASNLVIPQLLHGIGSIGVFSARAFLPAFVTALLLRFGPQVAWLARAPLLQIVQDVPTWFLSDTCLVVLGFLSAVELVAERIPEAKASLAAIHEYLKTGMATLTYIGVLDATDLAVVEPVLNRATVVDYIPLLVVGVGTFLVSQVRTAVLDSLGEADEDDNLGLQQLLRWSGDLWGGFGAVVLIVFPLLTLALFSFAFVLLVLAEKWMEARADAAKVPCAHCGQPIHASAPSCPSCHSQAKEPRAVGFLGNARDKPADVASLPFRLVAVKRCPTCATRLGRRAVKQVCNACGNSLMDDPGFARAYIASIDRRVPLVCGVCLLLGLVPILGVIPGVMYYRLAIIAPFRRYLPSGRGFLARWGVRLAILALVAFPWIPVAGGLALPAMALINYAAYRHVYRKLALAA